MERLTCSSYIKRDSTVCGNNCWHIEGSFKHWFIPSQNAIKVSCKICGKPTIHIMDYAQSIHLCT